VFGVLLIVLFTYVTQQLWNWLVPQLFAGPLISFWQTFGLLVLSKIIFSGIGGKCHHGHQHNNPWKEKMKEKFSHMSPEERDAFKQKMWAKWCPSQKEKSENSDTTSND
jgi:hypothetical protein